LAIDLKDDINEIKRDLDLTQADFEKSLIKDGSLQGYLFKCLKCGKYRLTCSFE